MHECLNNAFCFCLSLRKNKVSLLRLVRMGNSSSSSKVHPNLPDYHANVNNLLAINMLQKFDIYRSHCWLIVCFTGEIRRFSSSSNVRCIEVEMIFTTGKAQSVTVSNYTRQTSSRRWKGSGGDKTRQLTESYNLLSARISLIRAGHDQPRELVSNSVYRCFSLSLENVIDTSTSIISFLIICQAPEG